jgi:hypothetical protein
MCRCVFKAWRHRHASSAHSNYATCVAQSNCHSGMPGKSQAASAVSTYMAGDCPDLEILSMHGDADTHGVIVALGDVISWISATVNCDVHPHLEHRCSAAQLLPRAPWSTPMRVAQPHGWRLARTTSRCGPVPQLRGVHGSIVMTHVTLGRPQSRDAFLRQPVLENSSPSVPINQPWQSPDSRAMLQVMRKGCRVSTLLLLPPGSRHQPVCGRAGGVPAGGEPCGGECGGAGQRAGCSPCWPPCDAGVDR